MKAVRKRTNRTDRAKVRRAFAANEFRRLLFDALEYIKPRQAQTLFYKFVDGHPLVLELYPTTTKGGASLTKFTAGYKETEPQKSDQKQLGRLLQGEMRKRNLDHARKLIREVRRSKRAR